MESVLAETGQSAKCLQRHCRWSGVWSWRRRDGRLLLQEVGGEAMFKALFNRILSGKSSTLLPHEKMCLDAWREVLRADARAILDEQLASVRLVQRQAEGAKLCFFYPEHATSRHFPCTAPDLHAATVVLADMARKDDPVKQMRVKIYLHRGRFFSIEFPKRPSRYAEQHGLSIQALEVLTVQEQVDL